MKCLFETNNESGHRFHTMSWFIPWSAYLRLIMSQGIVFTQCHDSYHEVLILRLIMNQGMFLHNVPIHTMKCLFETNNESGHRFHTMSWFIPWSAYFETNNESGHRFFTMFQFIPWSAYLRLIMSQGIVSSQCHHKVNHTPTHSPCTTYTHTQSLPMHNLYTHPITHPMPNLYIHPITHPLTF